MSEKSLIVVSKWSADEMSLVDKRANELATSGGTAESVTDTVFGVGSLGIASTPVETFVDFTPNGADALNVIVEILIGFNDVDPKNVPPECVPPVIEGTR